MSFPVSLTRALPIVLTLVLPWLNVSCSSTAPDELEDADLNGYWAGNTMDGEPKIVIDLTQQRLRYFKGDNLAGVARISSGRESHATRPGQFRILDKDHDHRSSLYGSFVTANGAVVKADVDSRRDVCPPGAKFVGADMPHFMRIVGGIGMHAGYLPGYPASHGCIRLPKRMAELFFEATPTGTPVEIIGQAATAIVPDKAAIVAPETPRPSDKPQATAQVEPQEHRSFFRRLFPTQKPDETPASKPAPQPKLAKVEPQPPSASGSFFKRLSPTQKPAAKPAKKPAPQPKLAKTASPQTEQSSGFFHRLFSGQKSKSAPASQSASPRQSAKPKPKTGGSTPPRSILPTWKRKPPPGTTRYL